MMFVRTAVPLALDFPQYRDQYAFRIVCIATLRPLRRRFSLRSTNGRCHMLVRVDAGFAGR
jgi:hypothetical protein